VVLVGSLSSADAVEGSLIDSNGTAGVYLESATATAIDLISSR
jgi:hypothetical protein